MAFSIGELFFDIRARKDKFVADLRGAQDAARRTGGQLEQVNKRIGESFESINRRAEGVGRTFGSMTRFVGMFAAIGASALAAAKAIEGLMSISQAERFDASGRALERERFLAPFRSQREQARIANIPDAIERQRQTNRLELQNRLTQLGDLEQRQAETVGLPFGGRAVRFAGDVGFNAAQSVPRGLRNFLLGAFGGPGAARTAAIADTGMDFTEISRNAVSREFGATREQTIGLSQGQFEQEQLALFRQLLEGVGQVFNQAQAEALFGRLDEIREALKENTRAVE